MAQRVGGEQSKTETEYKGTVPTSNTVTPQPAKLLSPSEKLRLGYLTGQEDDTEAPRDPAHMHGAIEGSDLRRKR